MGTAALDKLLSVGDPTPQQSNTSALDKLLIDNKPKPTLVQPVQSDGILDTLGNYAKYIYHLAGDKDTWQQLFLPTAEQKEQSKQMFLQTAQVLGHNLSTFTKDAADILTSGSPGEIAANPTTQKYIQPLMDKGVGGKSLLNPANLFMGMAQIPIQVAETFTGTKNQEGQVVPATPDDEAKNIQSLVGMVVAGGVAGKIMKVMAPTTADLIATNVNNYPGLIVKAAYPKLISGMAAGASFGAIKDMGSEDQLGSMIGNSLAFGTIGSLFHTTEEKYTNDKGEVKTKTKYGTFIKAANELGIEASKAKEGIRNTTKESASNLLATRGLQITGEDSPVSVGSKIKAYATSDDAIDAYINSNLTIGKQVVVEDLSPDQLDRLTNKYMPSPRSSEGPYTPSKNTQQVLETTKFPVSKNQFIEPIDPFDKSVLASEKNPDILDELKDQTGLTDAEIKSHRNYIKDQTKTNQADFKPRTPFENQVAIDESIQKGQDILGSVNDGQSFQDINGKKWIKTGNKITDGKTVLDTNDPVTQSSLGMRTGNDPNAQVWRMPKQDFSPDYGRELNPKVSVYRGPNGETLISSYPLAKEPLEFFQKTGYQANELVTINGNPHVIRAGETTETGRLKVTNLATGKNSSRPVTDISRIPGGSDSEFYKANNGQTLTRMGILNRDSYMDNLYNKFKTDHFKLDEEPQEAYNTSIMKFAQKMGMKNMDDIQDMGREFYSRMVNDVTKDDPELEQIRTRTLQNMEGFDKHLIDNRGANLSSALTDNNMSLTHRGSGIYDIKDMESGKILQTVKSLDDAVDFIKKSGQANGFDLDGGFSNGTPVIGGSLKDTYVPHTTKFSNWWDRVINAGGTKSTGGVPQTLIFQKSALLAMDKEYGTQFSKHFVALQHAQNIRANNASSSILTDFIKKSNVAMDLGSKIDQFRRGQIGGELTKIGNPELVKNFKLGPDDIELSNQIAKIGSSDVIDLMDQIRSVGDYKEPIGSTKFQATLQKLSKNAKPEVQGMVRTLFSKADGSSKLSGVLKLAQNIENGNGNISLSAPESKYLAAVQTAHNSTPGISDPFFTHLANSKLAEITGHNPFPGYSDQFLRQVNKIGSTNSNQIELDPSTHLFNFRLAAINTAKNISSNLAYFDGNTDLLSFKQVIDNAQKEINSYTPLKDDPDEVLEKKHQAQPAVEFFQQHLDDVKGVPNLSDKLGEGLASAVEKMYGSKSVDGIRFANALIYSSLLGLRPAFAARDMWNVFQNTVMYDSFEAGLGVMSRSVRKEQAKILMDKGIIATQKGLDLLSPNESLIDGMGRLSKLSQGAAKLSDIATKYNGQQLAHTQASAGTYLYYNEKVANLSAKMLKNDISKQDAYTELKIQKLPPEEQKSFDDLISAGKTDQAGDMLGRSMVDRLNVVYGRNNAPQAWRSWYGRIAGGFGQWATHQVNTNVDILGRGTNSQRISSAVKMAATNAAVMGAGIYTGVNLSRWMITPFALPGESPLMANLLGGLQGAENSANEDPTISDPATSKLKKMLPFYLDKDNNWTGSVAHLYLPMSYFAQDIYDSIEMAKGDFGASSAANALGFSTIKSAKSGLQEDMGNEPEWQGKQVPVKELGPKLVRDLNPF